MHFPTRADGFGGGMTFRRGHWPRSLRGSTATANIKVFMGNQPGSAHVVVDVAAYFR